MSKSQSNFRICYALLGRAFEKAQEMAGENGDAPMSEETKINELKRLTREAACAANAISATWDGHSKPKE
jgi:hypothetical protein